MKCQEIKQHIVMFLDGELEACHEDELFRHLSSCSSCSNYMDVARETDDMLRQAINYVEPPKDFARQIMLRLESDAECCTLEDTIEDQDSRNKKWLAAITRGWIKTGVAASIAVMLLFGGLGLSGSASMDDSLAKRVFLISRDGISGIRRVVDNVINLAQNEEVPKGEKRTSPEVKVPGEESKIEEENLDENNLQNEASGEENAVPEVTGPDELEGRQLDIALREEIAKQQADAEVAAAIMNAEPGSTMVAVISPVLVTEGIDNVRPVWIDDDTLYYLSEKNAPNDGAYVIWETNAKGTSRRMISSPGYCMTLDHGGGVWSPYHHNYAIVTNQNGYWQIGYCNLKGKLRMAVSGEAQTATPAQGVLWEYSPSVSSNGDIAFLTKRFGNADLMIADSRGKLRVISQTPENESNPVWSADGVQIAFCRTSGETGNSQLFVMDKDGKNVKALSPSISKVDMVSAWSPDGNRLAVNINGAGDKKGLWTVNSDGSNWKKVSDKGGGKIAAWSSDGKMMAFTDNLGQLYVWDATAETADSKSLLRVEPDDQKGTVEYVAWRPKSKQLLLEWNGQQNRTKAVWRAEIIKFRTE